MCIKRESVCVLDFAVSLSLGTAESPPPKKLHPPLLLSGAPAVFGDIKGTQRVCVCGNVLLSLQVFVHTLVYFASTWGLSLR